MGTSDFGAPKRTINAVRKQHECEQCGRKIIVGSPAVYHFGIWEGYPFSAYEHPECSEAGKAYATEFDLWFEEYPWFQHMDNSEFEHHDWLREKFPVVAERLSPSQESTGE